MQRQFTITALALIGTAGLITGSGCTDELKAKEAHIALLEDTNQRLTEDLAAAQRRADGIISERERCAEQLLAARRENERLRGELAEVPEQTAPEGWQAVPGGAMIAVPGSVLFASGKAALRDSGQSSLDAIAATIRAEYPTKDIFVFGHTDDQPIRKSGWEDNYELSAQRALTVVRYLKDHGISPTRLIACGAGEHRPEVPNTNKENRARNRRVEIYAVEPIES